MPAPLPRILVVDDEPHAVELLVRTLRKQASIETACSGDEAWAAFEHEPHDLVISDQRMPGLSGVDLLSRIAGHDDTVGRILLTGYSDLEATVEAINRGRVHAYLHKPCSPPDLIATVKGVADRVALARENAALLDSLRGRNHELDAALSSLEAAQSRVIASERLAAIGKTTAMIVHDLRSPLTVLLDLEWQARELGERLGLPDLGQISGQIEDELSRMKRMCEEMLEVTHASEGARKPALDSLDDIVNAALAPLAQPAAAQGVQLDLQLDSHAELELDEDGLRRMLRNLANNALEAMPDGGSLKVESRADDASAILRVSDTGPGIPDEIADCLFEPFVTSGKRGGTGLGLAVVEKVVLDHGGEIAVGKPEGGGTAFTIQLPLKRSE